MHACWLAAILIVSPAFLKATDLSLSEKEEFLRTAAITQKVKLATGVTRSTRATLSSQELSHDAHIQSIDFLKLRHRTRRGEETNFRDSWKYN
ncbi:MAG TPA: hypothetical protein VEQ63_10075, partial [Bryobacteraceae bacterium]|nr:hypothetical protein [Bryobacteraceae bacterium]